MLLIVTVGTVNPVNTNETPIDCGEFDAPRADTVILPTYVLDARPAGLTDTVIVFPEADTTNQAALDTTEYESVPPPVLATVTVCAAGVAPPTANEKVRLVDDSEITGGWEGTPAIMLMASEPLAVVTLIVAIPIP